MARTLTEYLLEVNVSLQATLAAGLDEPTERAVTAITDAFRSHRPLLVCGNGGSAADAMHIAAELVGRFLETRPGLPCYALTADPAFLTAWSNDCGYDGVFARQVQAYGAPGGVLLGLSTSGNSPSVLRAFEEAHRRGMTTVALTGRSGGGLANLSDILLNVPADSTPHIQEMHVCLYHFMCMEIERRTMPAGPG